MKSMNYTAESILQTALTRRIITIPIPLSVATEASIRLNEISSFKKPHHQ